MTTVHVPHFTCPRCGAVSYNRNDIEQGYCGRCHDWTGTTEVVELPALRSCPECEQGKHDNCSGLAWDNAFDQPISCPCHVKGHL